jgi:hypothetical protein
MSESAVLFVAPGDQSEVSDSRTSMVNQCYGFSNEV